MKEQLIPGLGQKPENPIRRKQIQKFIGRKNLGVVSYLAFSGKGRLLEPKVEPKQARARVLSDWNLQTSDGLTIKLTEIAPTVTEM